jgi:hypothetical protein
MGAVTMGMREELSRIDADPPGSEVFSSHRAVVQDGREEI